MNNKLIKKLAWIPVIGLIPCLIIDDWYWKETEAPLCILYHTAFLIVVMLTFIYSQTNITL